MMTGTVFHMTDIIRKTKHSIPLTDQEIGRLVQGITAKNEAEQIPQYQLASWLMAVCLRGLSDGETIALTEAMRDSGQVLHWDLPGAVADKHSTGGVGDKTTLIVTPIAAACGIYMPKMSGRGLGHTGGTIDKLESIPGFCTGLSPERFLQQVREIGFAVTMQTGDLAPADKKLYALRDVTETVDSIPLICASIMSKKLATGADHILLDVKVGSGAFMKNDADASELARLMLLAAQRSGRQCAAVLTDMDEPLGMYIGNALEVQEAVSVLKGDADSLLGDFCIRLAARLLMMAAGEPEESALQKARNAVTSGAAYERFCKMVASQGGDPAYIEHPEKLPRSACSRVFRAAQSGYLAAMESETIGRACVKLGAGRLTKEDAVDAGAGIILSRRRGDAVQQGEPVLTMYAATEQQLDEAEQTLSGAVQITAEKPAETPMIRAVFS